jgi:peptidyl-prolyl cis-trans isomerase B (cyclophilin B)
VQVPTNQQRREAAKRKLERQIARRAERAKRRRIVSTAITVTGVVVVVGLIYLLVVLNSGDDTNTASGETTDPSTPPAQTTGGPCKYASGGEPAAKQVDVPPDVDPTPNAGTVKVALKTNQGEIPLTLDRAKAPCTVQAIEHLVKSKYFDGTPCHRLTASSGLKVLQCGDPTGQGSGGPGFSFNDELGSLPKAPAEGQPVPYPRGTLAMANSGPNTNGSQFFMVYGDSQLPPNYTVFGTIDAGGLTTLDKIAAGGITAAEGSTGPAEDGAPKNAVTIETAAIA